MPSTEIGTAETGLGRIAQCPLQHTPQRIHIRLAQLVTPFLQGQPGQRQFIADCNLLRCGLFGATLQRRLPAGYRSLAVSALPNVDFPTIQVSANPVSLGEGGSTSFDVTLSGAPAGSTVFNVASNDTGAATVSPATLTFTPGDFSTPQTVTGSGVISGTLSDGTSFSGTAPTITVNVTPAMNTTYTVMTLTDANCTA